MSSRTLGIEAVAAHFAGNGLTIEQLQDPSLSGRRPETLIANIEGVWRHFKDDGLVLEDYLQAATKQPSLFYQKPKTLIANIEAVWRRFNGHGLVLRDYLQAATKQRQLFYQKPEKLIANIEGVWRRFKGEGLVLEDYLQAATKQPQLFAQKPETIITNIEGVWNHFKDDGLLLEDYLQAALKQPQLFYQKPETLIGNIEGVYRRFKDDGLLLKDYLQAATKQPSLFSQKSETIIEHITIMKSLYRRGKVTFSKVSYDGGKDRPLKPLFEFLTRNPLYMCLSSDNLTLREFYATVTGAPPSSAILTEKRRKIEQTLFAKYGHSDRTKQVPLSGYHDAIEEGGAEARKAGDTLMLRVLIRGGLCKGSLEEPERQQTKKIAR